MKWSSVKTHTPSIDGNYILRCLNAGTVYFFEGRYTGCAFYAPYAPKDMVLEFTHFCIPDAIPIED